jgi:hypothetical protein
MKFTYDVGCECGGRIVFSTTGEEKFGPGECASCKKTAYLTDPLSVSVTAERLLYRSKVELENGDYSLSIVIATIAVESYLTRLFLKLKGMENYATTFELPNESMEVQWEKEYPRSGGFLKPSDFVAHRFTGVDIRPVRYEQQHRGRARFLRVAQHQQGTAFKVLSGRAVQSPQSDSALGLRQFDSARSRTLSSDCGRDRHDLEGDGPFEIWKFLSLWEVISV